jgi:hypothetical protein
MRLKLTNTRTLGKWLATPGHGVAKTAGAPDFFKRYGERFNPKTALGDIEV